MKKFISALVCTLTIHLLIIINITLAAPLSNRPKEAAKGGFQLYHSLGNMLADISHSSVLHTVRPFESFRCVVC